MPDLTIEGIRAECVAAGLPGARVVPGLDWGDGTARPVVRAFDGFAVVVRANDTSDSIADRLRVMRASIEAERDRTAARHADLNRVLHGPGADPVAVLDRLTAAGDGWGGSR